MTHDGPARVLSVGQCAPDHHGIRSLIERHFNARVDAVDGLAEALDLMRRQEYALVLVNRVTFMEGEEGLELIRMARQEALSVPIMLVSNYPESQAQAVAAGAVPGFGKSSLDAGLTRELLTKFLPARNIASA